MQIKKQAQRRRQSETVMRVGTLNIGSMTGRGREVADMMKRRRVDILCVQETRWKGEKARELGDGYKLYFSGANKEGRNGVGIVVSEGLKDKVLEVFRRNDRIMKMRLSLGEEQIVVISAYAPQVGCRNEEKEEFWNALDEEMRNLEGSEKVIVGGDLNGHIGEDGVGYRRVHGGHGVGQINEEGWRIMDFAMVFDMAIVNSFFNKREENLITYKWKQRFSD